MPFAERLQAAVSAYRAKGAPSNDLKKALYTSWYSPFMPIQEPNDYTGDLIEGYLNNEAIYSIVNKIANSCSDVPLELVDKDNKPVGSHWVNDLLKRPNEDSTLKELIYNYYVYLLSIGNSFMYAPKLAAGTTQELWTMPSDLVLVVSGPFYEPVSGYKFKEGNQEIVFPKDQVLHGKLFNPRFRSGSWVYGLSPVEVAAEAIRQVNAGQQRMATLAATGAPPFIISSETPEGLTAAQQEMLEATYKKKYTGSDSNDPMMSGTPLRVQNIPGKAADLELIESSEYSWRVLCNIYGVDSGMFNDKAASTYSNMQQMFKNFYQFTVEPLNKSFAERLKLFLIPNEELYFRFNYDDVEVLQEGFLTKSEALNNIWYMTPNERREQLGLEALDDLLLDEIYKPANMVPLEAPTDGEAIAQQEYLEKDGNESRGVRLQAVQKSA